MIGNVTMIGNTPIVIIIINDVYKGPSRSPVKKEIVFTHGDILFQYSKNRCAITQNMLLSSFLLTIANFQYLIL